MQWLLIGGKYAAAKCSTTENAGFREINCNDIALIARYGLRRIRLRGHEIAQRLNSLFAARGSAYLILLTIISNRFLIVRTYKTAISPRRHNDITLIALSFPLERTFHAVTKLRLALLLGSNSMAIKNVSILYFAIRYRFYYLLPSIGIYHSLI